MTAEDLDLVVAATGHARYRDLCDPAHPDHDPRYLAAVARRAAELRGEAPPPERPREPAPRSAKPRVPLGEPHCRECLEKREAAP